LLFTRRFVAGLWWWASPHFALTPLILHAIPFRAFGLVWSQCMLSESCECSLIAQIIVVVCCLRFVVCCLWFVVAVLVCVDLAIWKLQNHGKTLLSYSKCCSTSLALHSAIMGYILADQKMLFGNTLLPAPTRLHSGVTYSAAVLRSSLSPPRCSVSTTAC
jgi:hypothetical protein